MGNCFSKNSITPSLQYSSSSSEELNKLLDRYVVIQRRNSYPTFQPTVRPRRRERTLTE